jgi:aryl-alcohol dehydrogenase-like predicted oxidoreductase
MFYRPLGRTAEQVSLLTLGTMTWGEQNSEADAHAQIDMALEHGVTLIDAAEMYPVPPKPETQGLTERYLGSWIKKSGRRDQVMIASKATGPGRKAQKPRHVRGGENSFDRSSLTAALDGSLKRLQTDYLDLYQLHWPDRSVNSFGQRNYIHHADETTVAIEETLDVLADFVASGKIRYIGVSNETPWGVSEFLRVAQARHLPRIVSIQNPYNLLNRTFEIGLSEFSLREQVGLLAYSPLAFGVLSGKYLQGARPQDGRLTLFSRFTRYTNAQVDRVAGAYVALAHKYGLDPAQMALAYVNSRDFVTSNIIGATTLQQLESNLRSIDVTLPEELIRDIDALHASQPDPAP